MVKQIGIIGFGRIGTFIYEQSLLKRKYQIKCVYDSDNTKTSALKKSIVANSVDELIRSNVDLIVEAADHVVVKNHGPDILENVDMMILSATAFADKEVEMNLKRISKKNGTKYYIPHGALLGMDGLYDARETLESVKILTAKHPRNIDFSSSGKWKEDDIKEKTVLYDGPTREVCSLFPRNVNAHAVVALSCLGFDKTHSTFISDPNSSDALQHIIAEGGGAFIEIKRSSIIKGVTGDYTLASINGSIERAINDSTDLVIV